MRPLPREARQERREGGQEREVLPVPLGQPPERAALRAEMRRCLHPLGREQSQAVAEQG